MKYKFRKKFKFGGKIIPVICLFFGSTLPYKYMVVPNRKINSRTLTSRGELDKNAWQ